MTEPDSTSQIVILCSDMLFLSKITGTAKQLGYSFCTAPSCEKAAASLLNNDARQLLLIDLNQKNLDWELLASVHHRDASLTSIAFGSHVRYRASRQSESYRLHSGASSQSIFSEVAAAHGCGI